MSVHVDSKGTEQALTTFVEVLKVPLRSALNNVASQLQAQAAADAQRVTVTRTAEMIGSLKKSVSVGNTKARVKIVFAQPQEFYAAWLTYGLAPRPWRERAISRKGYLSSRIGKAKVNKPWGIRGRGFAAATQAAALSPFQSAVQSALEQATQAFNKA